MMGSGLHLMTLARMWSLNLLLLLTSTFVQLPLVLGQLHPEKPSQYQTLPTLREQAHIVDEWRQQRLDAIPELLRKHGVDAWLVSTMKRYCPSYYFLSYMHIHETPPSGLNALVPTHNQMSQREHAEDTIWWSIKSATEFAAHRRTVVLFHAGQPNQLSWIDNTGAVWPALRAVLAAFRPRTIAVNTNRDHAFAGGLHVGELAVLQEELGERWTSRFVDVPMLAIEYVSRRMPGQIEHYRRMQETAWALIEEAFSERVVVPGVTTTEVSKGCQLPCTFVSTVVCMYAHCLT